MKRKNNNRISYSQTVFLRQSSNNKKKSKQCKYITHDLSLS